eukprot:6184275-Pleurochrysis_carterae.AAC.3
MRNYCLSHVTSALVERLQFLYNFCMCAQEFEGRRTAEHVLSKYEDLVRLDQNGCLHPPTSQETTHTRTQCSP